MRNATEERVSILMLSTMIAPEILEYMDSGKVVTVDARGQQISMTRSGEPAGYWDGES